MGPRRLPTAELHDPARRAWLPTGTLSETRAYHTAARLPDGRVLVAGGWDLFDRPLTTTEIYDPAAGSWQPGTALAQGRAGHVAVALADGRILVAAGCGPNAEALASGSVDYGLCSELGWSPSRRRLRRNSKCGTIYCHLRQSRNHETWVPQRAPPRCFSFDVVAWSGGWGTNCI